MPEQPIAPRPKALLFGKLPTHGDFVTRGLSAFQRENWDTWITRGLVSQKSVLGTAFDEIHDCAPPWRFLEGPGSFGSGWRVGCLAPTIDSAGRRFMVMLCLDGFLDPPAGWVDQIAEDLENVIRDSFENAWTADQVIARASEIADRCDLEEQDAGGVVSETRWWTLGGPYHPPQRHSEGATLELWEKIFAPMRCEGSSC